MGGEWWWYFVSFRRRSLLIPAYSLRIKYLPVHVKVARTHARPHTRTPAFVHTFCKRIARGLAANGLGQCAALSRSRPNKSSSPSRNDMAEPRCPLGFTGPPPVGHPSISGAAHHTATHKPSSVAGFLKAYQPSTLLVLDALFLGLCLVLAFYKDDIKALWASKRS